MSETNKIQQLIDELQNFGFQKHYIDQVVKLTDNCEKAIELILQMQQDEQADDMMIQQQNQLKQNPFNIDFSKLEIPNFMSPQRKCKMVFMVRTDLGMGIGKIAAQTGHATLGAYKQISLASQNNKDSKEILDAWEYNGSAKIVLKVDSKEEFLAYEKRARDAGLNTYIVKDAGRTQIEPGSMTVAAIGPGDCDKIDAITGTLKLL